MIKKPLIFLHIPKTGGWTLHNILSWVYFGHGKVFNLRKHIDLADFNKIPLKQKMKIAVLKGHMPFGGHECFPDPEKVHYITMLRDPIKRIISNYYYILKLEKHPLHAELAGKNYSLKQYVESGIKANTENAQLRMISGHVKTPHGECTREMLEEAKRHLETDFTAFGLNEYYDESLIMMKQALNWRNPYYLRANVTGHGVKPKDLDQETMDIILKFNALDIELYDFAHELFKKRMANYVGDLSQDVARFRKKNARVQAIIRMKRKIF